MGAFLRVVSVLAIVALPQIALAASGGHSEGGGPPHLPNLFTMLHGAGLMSDPVYAWTEHWISIIYSFMTFIGLAVGSMIVYSKRQLIPGKVQNAVEMLVEGIYNLFYSVLGKEAKTFTPLLGTLFVYILVNNFWGLIPGGHSPSTDINITASLAIIVFLYSQYLGLTRLGIVGWLNHLAGEPQGVIGWCLVPLMFPLHIIGELAKPFSLAVRLFGNITGEDVLVAAFVGLGLTVLSFMNSPIGLPLNVPFILLGMLLSTIQAMVFAMLSSIYILMMLPHEEEHHEAVASA